MFLNENLRRARRQRNEEFHTPVSNIGKGRRHCTEHFARKVVYRCCDVVGQAISLYRAEQTGYRHSTQPQETKRAAAYDFGEIAQRVDSLRNDDAAWREWFRSEDITPLSVSYEQLDADPVRTTAQVLQYLGLPTVGQAMSAPNRKLADETTRQWRERFVSESG